jgi:18S rRNA (adenine1779-N6/adenine1780-N6)-dimethyltransferase
MPKQTGGPKRAGAFGTPAPYALKASASQSLGSSSSRPSSQAKDSSSSGNLITPNTEIGQHFLKNPAVVTSIVEKAGLKATDIVLEVGPGTGNMTVPMLKKVAKVIAVEFDTRMVREVTKRVEGTELEHKLTVIQGDVMKTALPYFDVCVANIPYQISSALTFKLLAHKPAFRCAVIMFQEEFALRLSARPGENLYCRLSVNCQLLAKVDQLMKVGRNNFRPPPKVESRVVRIEVRNPAPDVDFVEWDGMVRLLFNRKNKTMRSGLLNKSTIKMIEDNCRTHRALKNAGISSGGEGKRGGGGSDGMEEDEGDEIDVRKVLEDVCDLEIYKEKRVAKMDIDDFLGLLAEFNRRGIHFA